MKILILNLIPNAIGDCLFLTPMFSILKKKYENSRLNVTVSKLNQSLFENNKYIDNLISLDELTVIGHKKCSKPKKMLLYLKMMLRLIIRCRKEKYNLCFVTQPNFPLSHLIPWLGGVDEKIGYKYSGSIFSFLLDKRVTFESINSKNPIRKHYLDMILDLLKAKGLTIKEKEKLVSMNVVTNTFPIKGKYVCLQPGGKRMQKLWPIKYFKNLSSRLINRGYRIVILGSKSEKVIGQEIKGHKKKIINLCGKTTIQEAASLMQGARLNICNDSGLAHISSAVGTVTAVIYGSTTPHHSKPYGKGKVIEIYYGKSPPRNLLSPKDEEKALQLMKKITVDKVYDKIKNHI